MANGWLPMRNGSRVNQPEEFSNPMAIAYDGEANQTLGHHDLHSAKLDWKAPCIGQHKRTNLHEHGDATWFTVSRNPNQAANN